MSIEFQFNSAVVSPQELQEQFPGLISAIQSYLPQKKKTVGSLIDEIKESLE